MPNKMDIISFDNIPYFIKLMLKYFQKLHLIIIIRVNRHTTLLFTVEILIIRLLMLTIVKIVMQHSYSFLK